MADDIEQSFPVEEKPLPGSQWSSVTKGLGNGILDEGGFPYRLIFQSDANATNQGILKCPTIEGKKYGQASLEGFFHKYTADITLDFPAVTKSTRYYVVLQFVPNRVTEGGLPVKAEVVKSLDYTSGKNYLQLYNVDREPNQLLTDATVRMIRPRVAPVQVYASESDLPRADKSLWGTLAVIHGGRNADRAKIVMAINDDAAGGGDWFWKTVVDPGVWVNMSYGEGRKWAGHGPQLQVRRQGNKRTLRGCIAPASGTFAAGATEPGWWMATLGEADRPKAYVRSLATVSSYANPGFARVEVQPDGRVYAAPSKETGWVDFGYMTWYVD